MKNVYYNAESPLTGPRDDMNPGMKGLTRVLKYVLGLIILIGLLLAFFTLRKFRTYFLTMDMSFFLLSVAVTLLVYVFEAVFTRISLLVFDERLPFLHSFRYSLVINAFGYLVSLGGLAHFATQIYVLHHHGIDARKSTLSRALHLVFFNIFFALFLVAGYTALLFGNETGGLLVITAVVSVVILILGGFFLAIFYIPFQNVASRILIRFLNGIIRLCTKKFRLETSWLVSFLKDLNEGFFSLLKKPVYLIRIILATAVIWVLWIGVMYLAFLAFGYTVDPWHLVTGFSIGQIIGVVSMLPGGAGTMEGSMALVFVLLGIPLETALGAIVLFRLTYYVIPFILSLPFYFSLKRKKIPSDTLPETRSM